MRELLWHALDAGLLDGRRAVLDVRHGALDLRLAQMAAPRPGIHLP